MTDLGPTGPVPDGTEQGVTARGGPQHIPRPPIWTPGRMSFRHSEPEARMKSPCADGSLAERAIAGTSISQERTAIS